MSRIRGLWRRTSLRVRLVGALGAVLVAALVPLTLLVFTGGGSGGPCGGSDFRNFTCYETVIEEVVATEGAEAALVELIRLRDSSSYALANCHTLAHALGRAALVRYGTVEEAVNHVDGTCWSGAIHGVYESYMAQFDDEELKEIVPVLCTQPPDDPYAFDYYNCLHGIGHGVTIRFGNDPFEGLPYCDLLEGGWEQSNCYTGVFMQNIVVDRQMHQSVRLDPENPVYPCDTVEERYKNACYLTQTSYILRVNDYDYRKGFEICDGVESDYVDTCYVSMGRDISGNSHREAGLVVERCSLGDPDHQVKCYIGAARNAVFHDHATFNADALCAIVPEPYREPCESARDSAAGSL